MPINIHSFIHSFTLRILFAAGDRGFKWIDGTPLDYRNWNNGEPDFGVELQCGYLYVDYGGKWEDRTCETVLNTTYYACKAYLGKTSDFFSLI